MPTKIKIIRAKDFLQTTPKGEIDFEASKAILIQVAEAKQSPADFDVLIDMRQTQWRLETFEIYELAATLGEHLYASRSKIAILTLPGTPLDPSEFLETCSRNRGVNMEAFTNYEDAMHWLFPTENHDMIDELSDAKGKQMKKHAFESKSMAP